MLPGVRFMIGAVAAMAMCGVAAFGLFTSVRLAREARINPLEARSMAFAERADWNELWQREPVLRPYGALPDAPGPVTLRTAVQHAVAQPVLPDLDDSFLTAQTVTDAALASASDTAGSSPPDAVTPDAVANAAPADQPAATEEDPATPQQSAVTEQAEPQETASPARAPASAEAAAAPSVPAAEEPGTTGSVNAADTRSVEVAPAQEPAGEPALDATRTATVPATESPKTAEEPITEPAPAAKAEPAPKAASKPASKKTFIHRRAARPKAARKIRRASRAPATQSSSFPVGSMNGTPARRTSQAPFPQNN